MADAVARPTPAFAPAPTDRRAERHPAGATLFEPGPADHVLKLTRGLVRLHVLDADGSGFTLRYVKPGDWFGEEALASRPRTVFAEAVTDVEVETVAVRELDPDERDAIAERLADAVHGLYRGMRRLARRRLLARVAAEILVLSDSAVAEDRDGRATVRITHDALADSVGSVRETVTKLIGELTRAGAVDAGYGRITVTDAARLRDLADG